MEEELANFLKQSNLNSYEVSVYITLLEKGNLSAKAITKHSQVPQGRIYDILESLLEKKVIEVMPVRPKIYHAITPKLAFQQLIERIKLVQKDHIDSLTLQAKNLEYILESKITHTASESTQKYWTIAYSSKEIFDLYRQYVEKARDEILFTGFINEKTIQLFSKENIVLDILQSPMLRNISLKILWNFEFDSRPLDQHQIATCKSMFIKLQNRIQELMNEKGIERQIDMRFIPRGIQTYFDIIDKERIFIKLQNPLSTQVFATMNLYDPQFALKLRNRYFELWENSNQ